MSTFLVYFWSKRYKGDIMNCGIMVIIVRIIYMYYHDHIYQYYTVMMEVGVANLFFRGYLM